MRLSEIHELIASSGPEDWNAIVCWGSGTGPSYKNAYSSWEEQGEGFSTVVDNHTNVAIYLENVNLSLAWGLERDNHWWDKNPRNASFDFAENYPDNSVSVFFADVFWAGNLVDRKYMIAVDGGRGTVPMPAIRSAGIGSGKKFAEVFDGDSIPLARLIHGFSGVDDFDTYIERSGLAVS